MAKRKDFLDVITLEEAKDVVSRLPIRLESEKVGLGQALGRITSENIYSPIDIPLFDKATVDGYAVNSSDTFRVDEDDPTQLKVKGYVRAGETPDVPVEKKSTVGIGTGAPIPRGADAVVMVEYCEELGDEINVYKSVAPRENIMLAGSDIKAGELIIKDNTRLSPRELGTLAAAGINSVQVYRNVKVAVVSIGDELTEPGIEIEFGKIYDINGTSITNAVKASGGEPEYFLLGDDSAEIRQKLEQILSHHDIIVTTAGTSAGVGDLMYDIVSELGEVLVHGVAIKPGKPTLIGICKDKPIFCLPGNPTSALITFYTFVSPLLPVEKNLPKRHAKLAKRIYSAKGRYEYMPVKVREAKAYPILVGSEAISTLKKADGYIEIPEKVDILMEMSDVEVNMINDNI